jgi:hypothetical protein
MKDDSRDPIEVWRDVSARAARMGGFRGAAQRDRRSGGAGGWPLGLLALVVLALVAGLSFRQGGISASPSPSGASNGPTIDQADDGTFRLELSAPHGTYGPDDPIEPAATITYLGPDATTIASHAASPVGFRIEEIGGDRGMGGGMDQPCLSTPLTRGVPLAVPFVKAGTPDRGGFDIPWYQDPVLRLPVGTWRIVADLDVFLGGCGGSRHQVSVAIVVTVAGQPPASVAPSGSVAPSVTPDPSPSLSADAEAARQIALKYVDALATGHAEQAWPLLSTWSRTVIGSFTTFADAERRSAVLAQGPPEVGSPSRDPGLLDPAALGERADDIKAVAAPNRTFVVSVRQPATDGAVANRTLVVAPVDGTWRIWPDLGTDGYAWAYPDGCAAFSLSDRRCEAVINAAASQAGIDRATATAIWLVPDPGCGPDPSEKPITLCTRTTSFVAGVRFETSRGDVARADIFCGVGPPSLLCSDAPGIQAVDLHGGYWDVPCTGEAPDGCPSPLPSLSPDRAASGTELRLASLDVPVGPVGHREVEIGTAVLVDGLVQEARFSLGDQVQDGFALDPGLVRMELRSTIAGRPPFDNAYVRGTFAGLEPVRVILVFDVTETSPGAVIHVTDVEVR